MPEIDKGTLVELLKPIIQVLASRHERKAVRESGHLRFWQDGMLKTLTEIAGGDEDPKTIKRLKQQYKKSGERVKIAVAELLKVRDKLGGGPVANAIDDVVNKNGFGKDNIRSQIHDIIVGKVTNLASAAKYTCQNIETLNAKLERLRRLVYD